MKKIRWVLLSILTVCCMTILTACGGPLAASTSENSIDSTSKTDSDSTSEKTSDSVSDTSSDSTSATSSDSVMEHDKILIVESIESEGSTLKSFLENQTSSDTKYQVMSTIRISRQHSTNSDNTTKLYSTTLPIKILPMKLRAKISLRFFMITSIRSAAGYLPSAAVRTVIPKPLMPMTARICSAPSIRKCCPWRQSTIRLLWDLSSSSTFPDL